MAADGSLPEGFELIEAGPPPGLPEGFELLPEEPMGTVRGRNYRNPPSTAVEDISARISAADAASGQRAMTHETPPDLGPTWGEALAGIPADIQATAAQMLAAKKERELQSYRRSFELTGYEEPPELGQAIEQEEGVLRETAADLAASGAPGANVLQRGVRSALVNAPVTLPALFAGILTRNPALAAAATAPLAETQSYGAMRAAGVDPDTAEGHAIFQGEVERWTEVLPFAKLLGDLPGGRKMLEVLVQEIPGESVAQVLQGASSYVAQAQAEGRPVDLPLVAEGLADAATQLPETVVATLVGSTIQTGAVQGIQRAGQPGELPEQEAAATAPYGMELPEGFEVQAPPPVVPAEPEPGAEHQQIVRDYMEQPGERDFQTQVTEENRARILAGESDVLPPESPAQPQGEAIGPELPEGFTVEDEAPVRPDEADYTDASARSDERERLEDELRGTARDDPRFGEIQDRLQELDVEERGPPSRDAKPAYDFENTFPKPTPEARQELGDDAFLEDDDIDGQREHHQAIANEIGNLLEASLTQRALAADPKTKPGPKKKASDLARQFMEQAQGMRGEYESQYGAEALDALDKYIARQFEQPAQAEETDAQIEANVRQAIIDAGPEGIGERGILEKYGITDDAMVDRYSDAINRVTPEDVGVEHEFEVIEKNFPKITFRVRGSAGLPRPEVEPSREALEAHFRSHDLNDTPTELREFMRDEYMDDPEVRENLKRLDREAGWDTVGGRRQKGADWTPDARKGETFGDAGVSKWLPKADWWPGRPGAFNEKETTAIIKKALEGRHLGKKQAEYFDYLLEIAVRQTIFTKAQAAEFEPTKEDFFRGQLEPTEQNAEDAALVAQAAELDEVAVERLAAQYEDDDAGFMQAIRELLDGSQNADETAPADGEVDQPETGVQAARDLFGQDVEQGAALNKRNRALDRRHGKDRAPVPADKAPPGDIFRDAADRERAQASAGQTDLVGKHNPLHIVRAAYPSGMTRPKDFEAAIKAEAPVGLDLQELSGPLQEKVVEALNDGTPVFIDSGAFGAFRRGGFIDAAKTLDRYKAIADKVDPASIDSLTVVAPDVIGNPEATLKMLRAHAPALADLMNDGVNVIVPVQSGEGMTAAEFAREATAIFAQEDAPTFPWGIPSNAAAMSDEQFRAFLKAVQPDKLHILGAASRDKVVGRLQAIDSVLPDQEVVITLDANVLRAGAATAGADRAAELEKTLREHGKRRRDVKAGDYDVQASRSPMKSAIEKAQKSGHSGGPGVNYVSMYQSGTTPAARSPSIQLMQGTIELPKKPIRREAAMRSIERAFGMKIFQGKPFKVRSALGYFRPSNFETRIKAHNDLEVAAHEFFHWLDRTYPSIRRLYHEKRFRDELKGVSYDEKKLFEGFAEFGRLFLTKEGEAFGKAPNFWHAFVSEAQKVGIVDKLRTTQRLMHAWYLQGAEARALSKIGPERKGFKDLWESATDGLVDREIQAAFDWLHSFKVAERTVTGDVQDATVSAYGAARLMAGARGVVKAVLNRGTIAFDGNGDIVFTGEGLRQIFEGLADEFVPTMAYFVGTRANELRGQGREKLLDADEIEALLAMAKRSPKFKDIEKAFERYQAFQDRMMVFYAQTGLTSVKSAVAMREANKSYVPFNRLRETLESGEAGHPTGAFRRLKGGTENLRDTWENIVGNVNALVSAGLRNHAKMQLYAQIGSGPKGQKFAVPVPTEQHATLVDPMRLLKQLSDRAKNAQQYFAFQGLINEIGADPDLGEVFAYWSGKYEPRAPDIDMVLVAGKPKYFQIGDKLLMETLQAYNTPKPANMGLRVLGGFAGTLRRGITAAPDFLIPNLLRDTANAGVLSKGGQIPLLGSLRGMVKSLRADDDYWDFLANGGGFASFMHTDPAALRARMERYYFDKGIDYRTVIDTPRKLVDRWDDIVSAFEYGTRLAEYKARRKQGASKRQATLDARDISTDFGMRGTSELLRWITTGVPFMNAGLESLYRLEREVFERKGKQSFVPDPKKTAALAFKSLVYLTLPSILLWLRFKDDERYKEAPDWLKATHWVIPTEDRLILIPKPFEVGAIFATIPVQTLEYIEDRDGEKYAEAVAYVIAQQFRLDPTPAVVKPLLDLQKNRDFTGKPIIPKGLDDVAPEEQFTPYTSETAIEVGKKFGVSPIKLDYLVRGYFGTLGMYSISAADALVDPTIKTGEKPEGKWAEKYVLRRFMREYPQRNTQPEDDFYDVLDATREVVATFNKIKGDARAADAKDFLLTDREKQVLFAMRSSVEGVNKQVQSINSAMRQIRLSEDYTAEEKADKLDGLQAQKNLLFQQVMDKFDEARKDAAEE